jgi:hypothetical protein
MSVPPEAPGRVATDGRKRAGRFGEDLGDSGHSHQTSSSTKLLKGWVRATK